MKMHIISVNVLELAHGDLFRHNHFTSVFHIFHCLPLSQFLLKPWEVSCYPPHSIHSIYTKCLQNVSGKTLAPNLTKFSKSHGSSGQFPLETRFPCSLLQGKTHVYNCCTTSHSNPSALELPPPYRPIHVSLYMPTN